jgi:hypothetical protein
VAEKLREKFLSQNKSNGNKPVGKDTKYYI